MKFNVCVSSSSIHTQCFNEVALSVEWALRELGHEVTRSNKCYDDSVNVLFGVRPGDDVPKGSIIYNGEQVGPDGMWPHLVDLYKRHTVWDYSGENARRYSPGWGIPRPEVVRPGYCPLLDDGRFDGVTKTHDVVFFGSTNPRRERILEEVESMGLSVLRVPFGVYGSERDALIAKARLCLNIHFYDSAIFESIRCSYLAQCGVPVLTEDSFGSENQLWGIASASRVDLAVIAMREARGDYLVYGEYLREKAKQVSILDHVRAAVKAFQAKGDTVLPPPPASVSVPEQIERRTKHDVTLCMIVKDEKDVIERCLRSVKPFINRWSIVDTGSTDGTQDIIRRFMSDVPGQLHERPWKEFDGSRSESLDLARAECGEIGWLLMIDADEILQADELEIPDGFDCFNAWVTFVEGVRGWARPMLVRANKPWFFEMPRHEGLYCRIAAPTCPSPIEGAMILSTRDGARAKENERERYTRDAKVLESWALKHPGHARCSFYIAQSYNWAASTTDPPDRGLLQKAITYYLQRAEMPNDHPQETFSARYLAAQCMVKLGYPWERIQHTFLQAYSIGTSRAEPLYNIARHYRQMGDQARAEGKPSAGQYALAELFARKACQIGSTEHFAADVDHSVNAWRAMDELATSLTYLSGHAEARELFRRILLCPSVPPEERRRIAANLEMCKRVAPDPA